MTYRLLLPPFTVGDIVELDGEAYYVRSMDVKSVPVVSLADYRVRRFSPQRAFRARRVEGPFAEGMVVSITPPYVQVMDMDNYSVTEVRLPRIPSWISEGATVRMVRYAERVLLAPLR